MKRVPDRLRTKILLFGRVTPLTLCLIVLLSMIGSASTAPAQVVIYEEDFSSDPGWLTDQPGNFYWDAATEAYFSRTVNGRPEYTPNRYAYTSVPLDPTQPFELQWDQKVLSAGIGSRSPFGLMSPDLMVSKVTWYSVPYLIPESTVNLWMGAWFHPMPSATSFGVNAIDKGGFDAGFGSYSSGGSLFSLDTWYRNTLRYDPDAKSVDWSIADRASDDTLTSGVCTFPFSYGFTSNMVNLGVGNDPHGYQPDQLSTLNPDEYAEALFDNIRLTAPGTPPHEPGIYGLFVGVNDDRLRGDVDAEQLYRTMYSNLPGFREGLVLTADMQDGGVSVSRVEEAVDLLKAKMEPGDTFIFYAGSHGAGEDYTSTVGHDDERGTVNAGDEVLMLARDPLDWTWDDSLTTILGEMDGIQKWVMLDACGSGGFWGNYNPDDAGDLEKLSNIGLFASAGEGKDSYSDYFSYEGFFTDALEEAFSYGLDGYLHADSDHSSGVTFDELHAYLQNDWLLYLRERFQHPTSVWKRDWGDPILFTPDMWAPVSFASDDFTGTFNYRPIPAPSAILLAMLGIGLVGSARRRRTL